ncbi:hypothetical protein Cgig2_022692 [Carnegiea gigantea]|uniref:Uncharacterized protein n=1 Tax=Carnegiea gigantea TaxID=171969 RepID=A0A9Q1JSG6_9CARY|nr:hypothetical protein Cgig2_022692 [Carnegiea gigantea]
MASKKEARCIIFATKDVVMMRKVDLLKLTTEDFDPKLVVPWDDVEKVPFIFLCLAFEMIFSKAKTSLKMRIATNMLWAIMEFGARGDLPAVHYLSPCQIYPMHEGGSDLGIGESCVSDLLVEVYESGRSRTCCGKSSFISDLDVQPTSLDDV